MPVRAADSLTVSRDHFLSHMAGAAASGLDLAPIYRMHGLEPQTLLNPDTRLPYSVFSAVRLEVCQLLDDEKAGFLDRPSRWGSTVYFCRAIVSSRTLREALHRYEKFSNILDEEVAVRLVETPDTAAVEYRFENRKNIDIRSEIENRIFFLLSFTLWLADKRFLPLEIGFSFPKPDYADDYSDVVPCQYAFDQPADRLVFDASVLREPIRRSPRLLNQFLSDHLMFLIRENIAMSSVAERVRKLLTASAGANPDLESIAAALQIAPTTLRRRLKSEGCAFQALKDEARKTRAIHYLVEKRLTVAETAGLTGFSDPAAFSRAFKTWTGQSPSAFASLAT